MEKNCDRILFEIESEKKRKLKTEAAEIGVHLKDILNIMVDEFLEKRQRVKNITKQQS
jgi:hypothetical protein